MTCRSTTDLGEFARPTAHGAGDPAYPTAYNADADPQGSAIIGKGTGTSGLACLNYLIADALELVPDCLSYLELIKTPEVFRFSAIPQVAFTGRREGVHREEGGRSMEEGGRSQGGGRAGLRSCGVAWL